MEGLFLFIVVCMIVLGAICFFVWYNEAFNWNNQNERKLKTAFILMWVFGFIGILFALGVDKIRCEKNQYKCKCENYNDF